MARVKVNQFPATTAIADTDLGVVANPTTGISSKITWLNIVAYLKTMLGAKSEVNATTTPLTDATLNSIYGSAKIGDEVVCKDITDGPRVYKKMATGEWHIIMTQFNDAV